MSLEEAAHAAFYHHGYTLAAIAAAVHRDPSTVCRWIQRAAARVSAGGPLSSEGGIRARNKI